MASQQQTQADRIARSLKRLGFRMTRIRRSLTIVDDSTGEIAINSRTGMTLAEIELWIGEHIKPRKNSE